MTFDALDGDVRPLDALTIDHFRGCLDQPFRLEAAGTPLELRLVEVEDLGDGLARRAFSLLFSAPHQPVQPQAIRRLVNEELGPVEMFLVPLGPVGAAFHYQAVFT